MYKFLFYCYEEQPLSIGIEFTTENPQRMKIRPYCTYHLQSHEYHIQLNHPGNRSIDRSNQHLLLGVCLIFQYWKPQSTIFPHVDLSFSRTHSLMSHPQIMHSMKFDENGTCFRPVGLRVWLSFLEYKLLAIYALMRKEWPSQE